MFLIGEIFGVIILKKMDNLKNQILKLYQDWYDKYAFDTWHPYEEEIRRLQQLLEQIYFLVKEYKNE